MPKGNFSKMAFRLADTPTCQLQSHLIFSVTPFLPSICPGREKLQILMWLVRDKLLINCETQKSSQTQIRVGCYHDLWVSRRDDCRLRNGGQMRSCSFMDSGYMLLVLQGNNWRNRFMFGRQHATRLRRFLYLLLLDEALNQLMLHRNTKQRKKEEGPACHHLQLFGSAAALKKILFRICY